MTKELCSDLEPERPEPRAIGDMEVILRRLASPSVPSVELGDLFGASARREAPVEAKCVIHHEGGPMKRLQFLRSGWACRQSDLPGGGRQIFDILLPGDVLGDVLQPDGAATATVLALTRVETVDASDMLDVGRRVPDFADCLAGLAGREQRRLRAHIVRLAHLSATQRMAHFMLELHDRLAVVGLAEDGQFTLPLTQELLASMLGLSFVHVNRTLQELRRSKLIALRAHAAMLLDRAALVSLAHYRPLERA